MTRRLAWAAGASCGLIVGFLYGTVTLDWLSWRAVRRSEPRTPVPASTEPHEDVSAPQTGRQRVGLVALVDDPAWWSASLTIPAQRDDEPCDTRSPGGGLVCCRKGAAHLAPVRGHDFT